MDTETDESVTIDLSSYILHIIQCVSFSYTQLLTVYQTRHRLIDSPRTHAGTRDRYRTSEW